MATDKQKLNKIQKGNKRLLLAMGLSMLGMILTREEDLQEQIEYTQNLYTKEEVENIIEKCREMIEKLSDTENRIVL